MSKKFLLWLCLILFASAPMENVFAAYSSVEAYESRPIANIELVLENVPPNSTFDSKAIVSRLKTKVGDPFSQLTFDSDLKALSDEFDRVEPQVTVLNGEVYVTLKVWPKPLIRSIKWKGNKHINTKKLQKELHIKPHATYNRQAFNKKFNKVKEFYVKKGYFESQLQYTLTPDSKTNEVDIEIFVNEGRSGTIDNIRFKGFTQAEKSQILQMIYTKKYNLFISWLTGTGTYREEALDQDRLTIVNLLQDKGYADAKVDIFIQEAPSKGKIMIEIVADRGELFRFGRITFTGNELFTDEQIENLFVSRPEGVYSPEKLRQTAQQIKDMYGRKGYIDANVQYETEIVPCENAYDVRFQIEEGEEYKIGIIRVFGNVQTETYVILRESLLCPGETFDSARLKATQSRLENIGYFKNVNVYAVRTQDDQYLGDNYRDVYIEVEETTTGNASLFFGFSTADDLFGGLDLSENNFNYKGIPRIFKDGICAIRGGGEYVHARFTVGAKQRNYALSWLTPYFRDTLWRVGFDLSKTHSRLQSDDYDIDTYGGSVFAAYPLTPWWTFGTKYRIRHSTNRPDSDLTESDREDVDAGGLISAVGSSLVFDSTDNPIKPHGGFRSSIETEFVGIGGDFTFLRFGYLNAYYTPLWPRGTMKYRFDVRFLEPVWKSNSPIDIPVSERLFLGGEASVRGYRAFSLGPLNDKNDPEGGISSALLSVEYLHEVFRFLDLFVFADAGAVSQRRFNPGRLNLSAGYGARIEIINRMPIILGMGYPINPNHKSQVRRFFFSMGGQF